MSNYHHPYGKTVQQYRVVTPHRYFVCICNTPPNQQVAVIVQLSGEEWSIHCFFFFFSRLKLY